MGCLLPVEFPEFSVHPNWSLTGHMIFQTFSNVLVRSTEVFNVKKIQNIFSFIIHAFNMLFKNHLLNPVS